MTPAGIILAGGRATRMGGGDKALREVGGTPLLARVIARLAPQVGPLAISANGDPARLAAFGLPVLPDTVAGFAGPLAGVLAGLRWAAAQGLGHIVTAAGDTPFFPRDLARRLAEAAAAKGAPIALAATTDPERGLTEHPTFGLWPVALADDLEQALTRGDMRKMIVWASRHGAARAMFDDCGAYPFFNVNTPEDLRTAEEIALAEARRVYGVVGWKNSGKTTLMERLVAELCARGYTVSTVKHSHHRADVDLPGKDSFRHRAAGASQVLLASSARWALMSELRGAPEPTLGDLLARLDPVDLILVEGYKRDTHPKIEAWRAETGQPLIAAGDASVRAVATNDAPAGLAQPLIGLDDVAAIADFVLADLGLPPRKGP